MLTICDGCGDTYNATDVRDDDGLCDLCWRAALEHGHAHGLHDDDFGGSARIPDCPTCEAANFYVVSARIAGEIVWQYVVLAESTTRAQERAVTILQGTSDIPYWDVTRWDVAPVDGFDREENLTEEHPFEP